MEKVQVNVEVVPSKHFHDFYKHGNLQEHEQTFLNSCYIYVPA